jgi:hypothetical protein
MNFLDCRMTLLASETGHMIASVYAAFETVRY